MSAIVSRMGLVKRRRKISRVGIGASDAGLMRIMRLTTVFAGLAALLTAGGIGRLAAQAFADGGRRHALIRAARAHAVASAGLVLIAAIPHGQLPAHPLGYLAFLAAGLVTGAVCGLVIGAVCSGQTPVNLTDVWSIARKPSAALRNLLESEDLVRIGTALRTRTSTMFDGMFEPATAAPPPTPQPPATLPPGGPPPATAEPGPAAAPSEPAAPPATAARKDA